MSGAWFKTKDKNELGMTDTNICQLCGEEEQDITADGSVKKYALMKTAKKKKRISKRRYTKKYEVRAT